MSFWAQVIFSYTLCISKSSKKFSVGTNACYFENLDNVPKWTGQRDANTKQVVINTEWGAFGKVTKNERTFDDKNDVDASFSTVVWILFEQILIVNWMNQV